MHRSAPRSDRRHDLDWLRVIAFGILIHFHAAVAFLPTGLPMTLNDTPSPVLGAAVAFLHQFRLPLLFFVAGAGSCFALRHRSVAAWVRERGARLLVPLAAGVVLVVPPMVYLEKRYIGEFSGSFAAFYPTLFTSGTYPAGNLSWHHYWFIAYLYLYCLLLWPLLHLARGSRAAAMLRRTLARGPGIYVPIAALWLVETSLRPFFPGFRDLVHDWTDFLEWFVVLVAGYLFASQRRLLERTEALRRVSLALAVLASFLFFCWRASPGFADFHPWETGEADFGRAALLSLARVTNLWCWVLVCVGYASRYLNRPSRALDWLNDAVYPLFCLHLTALVAVEYVVLPRDWPIALEYATITTVATLLCLALYQWGVRRSRWLAPLFGARPGAG